MPSALQPISTTTISNSTTSSVTLNGFPATYRDLRLILSLQADTGGANVPRMFFNSDNTSGAYRRAGIHTSHPSDTVLQYFSEDDRIYMLSYVHAPSEFTTYVVDIMDYSKTTFFKNVLIRGGGISSTDSNSRTSLQGATYESTSAITSITLELGTNYFSTATRIDLYGIKG